MATSIGPSGFARAAATRPSASPSWASLMETEYPPASSATCWPANCTTVTPAAVAAFTAPIIATGSVSTTMRYLIPWDTKFSIAVTPLAASNW